MRQLPSNSTYKITRKEAVHLYLKQEPGKTKYWTPKTVTWNSNVNRGKRSTKTNFWVSIFPVGILKNDLSSLFKNKLFPSIFSFFLPFSLFPFTDNLLEWLAYMIIRVSIIVSYSLLNPYQPNFGPYHSAGTSWVKVTSNLFMDKSTGWFSIINSFDLLRTFDSTVHVCLLKILLFWLLNRTIFSIFLYLSDPSLSVFL